MKKIISLVLCLTLVLSAVSALAEAFRRLNGGGFGLDDLPAVRRVGPVEFILLNAARPCGKKALP